jgi:hypothetical protein
MTKKKKKKGGLSALFFFFFWFFLVFFGFYQAVFDTAPMGFLGAAGREGACWVAMRWAKKPSAALGL